MPFLDNKFLQVMFVTATPKDRKSLGVYNSALSMQELIYTTDYKTSMKIKRLTCFNICGSLKFLCIWVCNNYVSVPSHAETKGGWHSPPFFFFFKKRQAFSVNLNLCHLVRVAGQQAKAQRYSCLSTRITDNAAWGFSNGFLETEPRPSCVCIKHSTN